MIPGIVAAAGRMRAPPEPIVGGLYWRIRTSALDGGTGLSIAEFRMFRADALRTNIAVLSAGSAFGSPHYISGDPATYAPPKAFDNDAATIFATLNGDVQELGFHFSGEPIDVVKIQLTTRPDGGTYGQNPKDFVLQKSADGAAWADVLSVTGSAGWGAGETRDFFARSIVCASMPMSGPDGATFVDEQERTWLKSGSPVRTAGFGVFNGGSSIYLPSNQQIEPQAGDWTIELFGKINALGNQVFIGKRNGAGYTPYGIGVFGGKLQMLVSTTGGSWAASSAAVDNFPVATEQHIALQRRGNTIELFQEGVLVASGAVTGPVMVDGSPLVIGAWSADAAQFPVNGTIRGFKFSQGRALYADGYSVPSPP